MRDAGIALVIGVLGTLVGALWRGRLSGPESARLEIADRIQLTRAVRAHREIEGRAQSCSKGITDRLLGIQLAAKLVGDDAGRHRVRELVGPGCRRVALVQSEGLVLGTAFCCALLFGVHLRRRAMLAMAWRSPTIAYLAKKISAYGGLGGLSFVLLAPMALPLWLIYVFVGSLCGGLAVYVGSLGRI